MSLKMSCSCRLIVCVETTALLRVSNACITAGARYASDLPHAGARLDHQVPPVAQRTRQPPRPSAAARAGTRSCAPAPSLHPSRTSPPRGPAREWSSESKCSRRAIIGDRILTENHGSDRVRLNFRRVRRKVRAGVRFRLPRQTRTAAPAFPAHVRGTEPGGSGVRTSSAAAKSSPITATTSPATTCAASTGTSTAGRTNCSSSCSRRRKIFTSTCSWMSAIPCAGRRSIRATTPPSARRSSTSRGGWPGRSPTSVSPTSTASTFISFPNAWAAISASAAARAIFITR